jgi:hypothetical protein
VYLALLAARRVICLLSAAASYRQGDYHPPRSLSFEARAARALNARSGAWRVASREVRKRRDMFRFLVRQGLRISYLSLRFVQSTMRRELKQSSIYPEEWKGINHGYTIIIRSPHA